jgi:hypothetical protein
VIKYQGSYYTTQAVYVPLIIYVSIKSHTKDREIVIFDIARYSSGPTSNSFFCPSFSLRERLLACPRRGKGGIFRKLSRT